ncbi:MAG TPA: ATP-binding cassette domain-containing protein [Fibrobacteria bacterium]|nr:ATP-binding cassette domain-containing protein [Fibrobacteria bacterium]
MTPAFRLQEVSCGYAGHVVLRQASLEIAPGGILGMIGPNGAGKSTVLRLLLGLLDPLEGTVEVLGRPPRQARSGIGYVPQSLVLERDLPGTLEDLVLAGFLGLRRPASPPTAAELERAHGWMERLGVVQLRARKLSELSGGQLQLGLVARALVREPRLLLLDEPTANADARAQGAVFALLDEFCRERTAVVVSHDVGVLARNVRSIACVGAGTIVHHGTREVPQDALEAAYGCPVELIAHGHPHRVLSEHGPDCHHDHASCGGHA